MDRFSGGRGVTHNFSTRRQLCLRSPEAAQQFANLEVCCLYFTEDIYVEDREKYFLEGRRTIQLTRGFLFLLYFTLFFAFIFLDSSKELQVSKPVRDSEFARCFPSAGLRPALPAGDSSAPTPLPVLSFPLTVKFLSALSLSSFSYSICFSTD